MKRLLMTAGLALALPAVASAQLKGLVPIDVRVPKTPLATLSSGKLNFVYELRLTSLGQAAQGITRIEVLDGQTVIGSWQGDSLKRIVNPVGAPVSGADRRVIAPGRQMLAYLHVATAPGAAPKSFGHRIYVTGADSLESPARDTISNFVVAVDPTPLLVLRSPLKDGPWVAVNGPGNSSGHRRTVIPLDGLARIPQRFATDWIKLSAEGRAWKGDSLVNANWFGYNEPLLAVANATVVAVKDGIIENVPFSPKMAVPITLETVGGNHVILDLGNGVFAFYAHIIPGSIKVKVGDKVKAGDQIGSLGNSGNSTAPHLHFHVGDRNSPLGTEGLPFLIDEYTDYGVATGMLSGKPWTPGASTTAKKEAPFENHVVRFKP